MNERNETVSRKYNPNLKTHTPDYQGISKHSRRQNSQEDSTPHSPERHQSADYSSQQPVWSLLLLALNPWKWRRGRFECREHLVRWTRVVFVYVHVWVIDEDEGGCGSLGGGWMFEVGEDGSSFVDWLLSFQEVVM